MLQLSYRGYCIYNITSKTSNCFGDDQIDFSRLAICNHAVEIVTMSERCAGYALVGINASELPVWIACNVIRVVLHLQLITQCLRIHIGADAAVGTHARLRFFVAFHLGLGRDDLYLHLLRELLLDSGRPVLLTGCWPSLSCRVNLNFFHPFHLLPAHK